MLETYHHKRNFSKTPEPKGNLPKNHMVFPIFVIQEHHASHLHYDFRLEMEGVLKSWALPKGVPQKKGEKHLAILTEDHPIEYANFSGTIPSGQYGAGEVFIWDKGTFENLTHDPQQHIKNLANAFKDGHISICLHGKRLKNSYFVLQRVVLSKKEQWILLKLV